MCERMTDQMYKTLDVGTIVSDAFVITLSRVNTMIGSISSPYYWIVSV